MIRILDIVEDTMVDGPGFRTAVYCAGCSHACKGCHNPQSWDFGGGREMEVADVMAVIKADPYANVTFTGGDPMYQATAFAELARAIRHETDKTIWCYTGFSFEQLLTMHEQKALLALVDVVVDGPFVASLRDESLHFRGSSNQRIIDVKASLAEGRTVLWNEDF